MTGTLASHDQNFVLVSKRSCCADIVRVDREHGIGLRNNIYLVFWFLGFFLGITRPISNSGTTLFFNLGYVVVHDWRADPSVI